MDRSFYPYFFFFLEGLLSVMFKVAQTRLSLFTQSKEKYVWNCLQPEHSTKVGCDICHFVIQSLKNEAESRWTQLHLETHCKHFHCVFCQHKSIITTGSHPNVTFWVLQWDCIFFIQKVHLSELLINIWDLLHVVLI